MDPKHPYEQDQKDENTYYYWKENEFSSILPKDKQYKSYYNNS